LSSRAHRPIGDCEHNSPDTRRWDIAELEKIVEGLYAQPLDKRRYQSKPELAQKYCARADDLEAIEHFAQLHNLVVSHRNAAERPSSSAIH